MGGEPTTFHTPVVCSTSELQQKEELVASYLMLGSEVIRVLHTARVGHI